jgi:hypothetical protein
VIDLCRRSRGFDARCYTPEDGLGVHPGRVDEGPKVVATCWDPFWTVDIFHEIHAQSNPSNMAERGVFIVYPDGARLDSAYPNPGEVDEDVRQAGPTMARLLATATGLIVGGPYATGIMSERETGVGAKGRRLQIFAATATPAMLAHSSRFISEVGCFSNPNDKAILSQPDFPQRQAIGIVHAYAWLAKISMGWTFDYVIVDATEQRGHLAS